jgi:hypothetical protein
MNGTALQDLLSKGWGVAARRIGIPHIVYRPDGILNPIVSSNRIIKLSAAFIPNNGIATGATGYAGVLWRGVFDSLYTLPGDYLQGAESSFFIAAQRPMQPILCIETSNIITINRPQVNFSCSYSGFVAGNAQQMILGWPALLMTAAAKIAGTLPESHFGSWTAFMPILPSAPQVADIITDDMGRCFVVASAQLCDLGWRLAMRQVDG